MVEPHNDQLPTRDCRRGTGFSPEWGGAELPGSKLGAAAAGLAEAAWLAAVAVVPIFFNPHTERIFEEDKVPLLRSLALLAGASLLVWKVELARRPRATRRRPWWRVPLLVPALALTAAYLLSSFTSVAPAISWRGGYLRGQGTYTWLGYVTLFVTAVFLLRERAQVDRLVTLILLASIPPAVYALVQHLGLDPLPWAGASERVSGTAGNPVFLSAHLVMVVPLTVSRIVRSWRERHGDGIGRHLYIAALRVGAYSALLAVQLLAMLYSQSRGPFLALAVALAYLVALLGRCGHRPWLARAGLAGLAAFAGFIVALNLPVPALQPLRELPTLSPLARIFDTGYGTSVWVRASIWRAAAELLVANPWRGLLGYGPETQVFALLPVTPAELLSGDDRALADRAHNQVFDTLLTVGVLGLLAELALFLSFFVHTLRWLGLLATAAWRRLAYAVAILGAGGGVLLAIVADGTMRFAGIGLPIGMSVALLGLIAALGFARRTLAVMNAPDALVLMALSAGVLAHFIEVQVSFATTATRLYCWMYLALAVVLATRVGVSEGRAESEAAPGGTLTLSPFVALILVLLTAGFAQPEVDLMAHAVPIACVVGTTWLAGALLLATIGPNGSRSASLGGYAAATLGAWLLFAALYLPVGTWPPAGRPDLQTLATRAVAAPALLYAFTLLLVGWGGLLLGAQAPGRGLPLARRRWSPALAVVLLLGVGWAIVFTNLDRSRADALSRLGRAYEHAGTWDAARLVHEEALRWQPGEDRYALNIGRALIEKARQEAYGQPAARDALLAQAVASMQEAQRLNPLHPDHTRNLARAHRYWADVTADPMARAARLARAHEYYADAARRSPNDARLRQEWAALPH